MNRKERRIADKQAGYKAVSLSSITKAEDFKTRGLALIAAGKNAEAIPLLIEALKHNSGLADAHITLASLARAKPELNIDMDEINQSVKNKLELKNSYKIIQNILRENLQRQQNLICQEEICRLLPNDDIEKAELALLLNILNRKEEAIKIMADLVNRYPTNKTYKALFVTLMGRVYFPQFEPDLKQALQLNFDDIYATELSRTFLLWMNIILYDPACKGLYALENVVTDSQISEWLNHTPIDQIPFVKDRFFLSGLRLLTISSIELETLLACIRRGLCLNLETLAQNGRLRIFENFIFAMGEQSFFNEYIYIQPDDERAVIESLIEKIKTDTLGAMKHVQAYGIISCYQSLHDTFPDRREEMQLLANQSSGFAPLFKTQFLDVETEQDIKSSLASFGMLEDKISKNVQAQYEKNPYPRWISSLTCTIPNNIIPFDETQRNSKWRILVAGCGTGRHAIDVAATYPNARVTAIDISRTSLAYAQRKANEAGFADRIQFVHADILSMGDWPEPFDIIESAGVLHHMDDPLKGWQTLCSRLKPGGYFRVGLYSEIARQQVVEARDYIKELGFESTLEGLRSCRERIKQRPDDDAIRKWLIASSDFFTTSSLRDLIFHVQEHRMNLPQIQGMLDQLGLVSLKFLISDLGTFLKYEEQFPEDKDKKNLMNWHKLELENPQIFRTMYQFWSQKTEG